MLSLQHFSSKCAELKEKQANKVDDPEEEADWENFREIVSNSTLEEATCALISEFTKKSKEQYKCLKYLKMLIIKTDKMSNVLNREFKEKCVTTLYRALFELAQLSWSIPGPMIEDMINKGMEAIRTYPSAIISSLMSTYCIAQMKDNFNICFTNRWVEMFGRLVAVLNGRGDIPHESDVINGASFREYIVQELCRMDWSQQIAMSVLTILSEMPGLGGYEVDIILEKFSSSLEIIYPGAVHSSMTQIVQIAGNVRPALLLKTFDNYFSSIEANNQTDATNSKAPKKGNKALKTITLGSVAFNFVEAARHCDPIVREVLNRVKASVFDHTLITSPFTLAVVLGMTSVDYLRSSIVEPVRTAIIKSFHELMLIQTSKWYKDTRGEIPDVITDCFKAVLNESSSAMEYMSEGLKDIGINLLSADKSRYPLTAKRCRELGSFLVLTVVRNNKDFLALMSKELLKPNQPAHVECLAACLSECTRAISSRDFRGRITEILDFLPHTNVETASVIIKSLIPAFQLSSVLLDDLMIVLRKGFLRNENSGRVCVELMCVIMSNSFVVGNSQLLGASVDEDDLIFSQCTQGASRTGSDNSTLCHEMLNLAKRFFLLPSKVREQLYLGLHRVSRRNPILNEVICGMLHTHSLQYLPVDQTDPNFDNLFDFTKFNTVVVKDELGFLVQCVGFVYNKWNSCINHSSEPASFKNCKSILTTWVEFATAVDGNALEIFASSVITNSNEQRPLEVVRFVKDILVMQSMQIIEALLEFLSQASKWPDAKRIVARLFKKYQELDQYIKEQANIKKTKGSEKGKASDKSKARKKRKKNDEDEPASEADNASVISGSENVNPSSKPKKMDLHKSSYFHLINLDSVYQMLREMYGLGRSDKQGSTLTSLKDVDDFEILLLTTVKEKVYKLKLKESLRERQRAPIDVSNALTCLAETIWKKLVSSSSCDNTEESEEEPIEDSALIAIRLEVISEILELFLHETETKRLIYFNDYLGGQERDLTTAWHKLFDEWHGILDHLSTVCNGIETPAGPHLFAILTYVCKSMDEGEVLEKIHNWTWQYLKQDKRSSKRMAGTADLLESIVRLYVACNTKCVLYSTRSGQDVLKLAKAVRLLFGDIEEDDTHHTRHSTWIIKEDNADTLLNCITNYVQNQLAMISGILGRLKSHRQYLGIERTLGMRDNCFKMINSLRVILTELVRSAIPPGSCIPDMIGIVHAFYDVLSKFAEHLVDVNKSRAVDDSVSLAGFKNLVHLHGKDFKPRVESMIQHIEVTQRQNAESQVAGVAPKKVSAIIKKLSKEAKLIPDMIFQIEQFERFVIELSKKVEIQMLVGMKLSTARDFRVEVGKFKAALEEKNKQAASKKGANNDNSNADATNMEEGTAPPVASARGTTAKRGRKRKST